MMTWTGLKPTESISVVTVCRLFGRFGAPCSSYGPLATNATYTQ